MSNESGPVQRRYDLDWLRVLTTLVVLLFHTGRLFDSGGWLVKNGTTHLLADILISLTSNWMIPLMIVISGASIFYALRQGGARRFAQDKVLRLFVPLAVGAVTHCSLQGYLRARTQEGFTGSYWQFLPHYFDGVQGLGGHFPWAGYHLWYLEVLFVFSLLLLPLFMWLKWGKGRRLLGRLGDFLARPGACYLLALPGSLLLLVLNQERLLLNGDEWGGWPLPVYAISLVAGFVIASHAGLQEQIRRRRRVSLVAAVSLSTTALVVVLLFGDPEPGQPLYYVGQVLWSLMSWGWMLTMLGFGRQYLTRNTPFLRYANEAVLPFYALHQTVIVGLGYLVVQWAIPDLLKYLVVAVASFSVIMALYEFLVRRVGLLRFLFGMKPRAGTAAARPTEAAPSGPRQALPSA